MHMKNRILPFALLFCTPLVYSQDMNYNQSWIAIKPGERSLAFGIPQRSVFSDVQGTPYASEEFQEGTLYGLNNESRKGMFRYNAFTNEIQEKTENDTISLLRRDQFRTRIGRDLYIIDSYMSEESVRQSYFVEKNKGKARLLVREEKEYIPARFPGWSYNQERPARFKGSVSYFLSIDDQPATSVRLSKKDILGNLPNHQKKVAAFVRKNKMKMKTEEEVLRVLRYYNTL